jgi:uncharacterized membrane protein YedE/YeeE
MELIAEWRDLYGVSVLVVSAAVLVGAAFGWLGERSDYCARSAYDELLAGPHAGSAAKPNQLWQLAFASLTAIAGVFLAQKMGWINLDNAPLGGTSLNLFGLFAGAYLFGIGMALSRGCISRLVVLTGRGNVRALITLVFTALFAWTSISGILAVPRVYLAEILQVDLPVEISHAMIGLWIVLLATIAGVALRRGGPDHIVRRTAMAMAIGLLVPACFFITSGIGADEFEPVAIEGLRFTGPIADTLGYLVYSTAFAPKFGVGLIAGALVGAAASAALAGRAAIEGFANAPHPLRYITGALFMGFGGVLAGGCTIGWLLSGASVLNGGVLIAFIGFMAGNFSLRLSAFGGFLDGQIAPTRV